MDRFERISGLQSFKNIAYSLAAPVVSLPSDDLTRLEERELDTRDRKTIHGIQCLSGGFGKEGLTRDRAMAAILGEGAVDPETLYTKQTCIGMGCFPDLAQERMR